MPGGEGDQHGLLTKRELQEVLRWECLSPPRDTTPAVAPPPSSVPSPPLPATRRHGSPPATSVTPAADAAAAAAAASAGKEAWTRPSPLSSSAVAQGNPLLHLAPCTNRLTCPSPAAAASARSPQPQPQPPAAGASPSRQRRPQGGGTRGYRVLPPAYAEKPAGCLADDGSAERGSGSGITELHEKQFDSYQALRATVRQVQRSVHEFGERVVDSCCETEAALSGANPVLRSGSNASDGDDGGGNTSRAVLKRAFEQDFGRNEMLKFLQGMADSMADELKTSRGTVEHLEVLLSNEIEMRQEAEYRLEHALTQLTTFESENKRLRERVEELNAENCEQGIAIAQLETLTRQQRQSIGGMHDELCETRKRLSHGSIFGGGGGGGGGDGDGDAGDGHKPQARKRIVAHRRPAARVKNPINALLSRGGKDADSDGGPASAVAAPGGRVALVFTDIQGSTALWEALSERMHVELEKHNTIMREEIKAFSGYEVKTQGDSFMAAFKDVTSAACFCLSVQLRLLTAEWDPLLDSQDDARRRNVRDSTGRECAVWGGLRVRMGVHAGHPICQPDVTSGRMDYFGPVVNQAARVQGKGFGGMTCVTPEVQAEIELAKIPRHLTPVFEPFGTYSLRGIADPVELNYFLPSSLSARRDDFALALERLAAGVEGKKGAVEADETEAVSHTGMTTFAYVCVENAAHVQTQLGPDMWEASLALFQSEVTCSAEVMGGHVTGCEQDRITMCFQHAAVGFRWALELQESLVSVSWDAALQKVPETQPVEHQGRRVLDGLRACIGMHACNCEAAYDTVTKKYTYFGIGPMVAAVMGGCCKGGETHITGQIHEEVAGTTYDIIVQGQKDIEVDGAVAPFEGHYCFPRSMPERANYLLEEDVCDVSAAAVVAHEKITSAPVGTVALVFTDVQNSTVLWELDEDVMAASVRLHHNCMRNGIQKYKGYEVKTEGDAFMVAFTNSFDALRWCLYMQEMLLKLPYPAELMRLEDARVQRSDQGVLWRGLRVRMGVHIGQPQCERDPVTTRMDYYGQMVNKAARISGLPQGGQIVISDTVFAQVSGSLRELGNPVITDNGEVTLKGIKKKARTYFVVPRSLQRRNPFKPKPVAKVEDAAALDPIDKMVRAGTAVAVAAAPTGRVAISFTDIQNSTVLWEKCSQMQDIVQQHHKVMREGIRLHNGYEVKTEGDAFMVCFPSTKDGLSWCLDMQRKLLTTEWCAELLSMKDAEAATDEASNLYWRGPRVRMGLHVGEKPDLGWEQDDCTGRMDYYGRMVNKAARVSGLGKGGEIVLSQDCHDEVAGVSLQSLGGGCFLDEERGMSVVNMGEKKLKGIDQAVVTYSYTLERFSTRRETWAQMDLAKTPPTQTEAEKMLERFQAEMERREEERRRAPTGEATLVFTDVQGSTKLWDTDQTAMAEAVRIHHEVMRRLIQRMGGYEVKTEGDAFMVAFHGPTQACKWCIAVQKELLEEAWPEPLLSHELCAPIENEEGQNIWNGLRVRMGFHVGEVEAVVDPTTERVDYYGPTVNAAARVGGIGTGGEIVTTLEAIDAIDMAKCGGPVVTFLEARELKGITREFNIFRVTPMELVTREFAKPPPPQPPGARRRSSRKSSADSSMSLEDGVSRSNSVFKTTSRRQLKDAREDSFRKDGANYKEENAILKVRCKQLEKADQDRQFEVYCIHKHIRIFMHLIRKYGDCAVDRTKGVFSQTDMVHEWIKQHRSIMAQDVPGDFVPMKKEKKDKTKPNVEIKTQKELAIETQKEEEAHVSWINDQYNIATSKLSRSIVGHLSKHFFYVHTNLVQPLAKVTTKLQGGDQASGSRFPQAKASRRSRVTILPDDAGPEEGRRPTSAGLHRESVRRVSAVITVDAAEDFDSSAGPPPPTPPTPSGSRRVSASQELTRERSQRGSEEGGGGGGGGSRGGSGYHHGGGRTGGGHGTGPRRRAAVRRASSVEGLFPSIDPQQLDEPESAEEAPSADGAVRTLKKSGQAMAAATRGSQQKAVRGTLVSRQDVA